MTTRSITFADGRELCVLGQGTWNLGRDSSRQKVEEAALLEGIDLGMTMIDTAEMYQNEEFIGKVIRTRRKDVFLVSKVHPQNADYEGTIRSCEQSIRRLGTEIIDLYLLHWKSDYPFEETIAAMTELVQQGKIAMWGVSNIDLPDMKYISALTGGCACDANQVLYNLMERGIEYDLLPWSRNMDIPIIAYTPFGDGRLLGNGLLHSIAEKHSATPAQIALAWTIRDSGVMAIPKASSVKHVRDNFGSLSVSLDSEDLKLLNKTFPQPKHRIPLAGW